MNVIICIIIKEFKQIFRDKGMLPLIFVMPFIQLVILANAVTFEIKNIKCFIIDNDKSGFSRELTAKFQGNKYFKISGYSSAEIIASNELYSNNSDMVLTIPAYFEKSLTRAEPVKLRLSINAIDGSRAQVIAAYANYIITDFYGWLIKTGKIYDYKFDKFAENNASIIYTNRYNERMDYKPIMVPGILVILVSVIGMFLSAMSIAKEKELGTIEQLNVTPILKHQLIIGKLIPVLIIGLLEFSGGLLIAKFVFAIKIAGSVLLIYAYTTVFLIVMLAFGMLISTLVETQQQAMFLCWFFIVIFILLSGLFTPIESMPRWAQILTDFIPMKYFIQTLRAIILKGAGFKELQTQFAALAGYAIAILSFAYFQYHKVK